MQNDLFRERKEQTVSKHNIFENYLAPWANIISSQQWVKRAYYVDAFAGTGKYFKTGEPGSPVIACGILERYQKPNCKFDCFFIEKNRKRYDALLNSLKDFEGKINVTPYRNEFMNVIDEILGTIGNCPAFFFIDPSGFSGMDFVKIERILNASHKEVLINFQYNAIQRWLRAPKVEKTITDLFGTSDYRQMKNEQELIGLYADQIKKAGSFVYSFRNKFSNKNRTFYYLVYATKNITGFKIMKEVMSKEEIRRYFEPYLFEEVDFQTFQDQLYERYKGTRNIEYNEILVYVLQDTQYLASDLDKALRNLGAKKIANPSKKSNPFIIFPDHSKDDTLILREKSSVDYYTPEIFSDLQDLAVKKLKITYQDYELIDGTRKKLVQRVNDGSIVIRFDKTPLPEKPTDVVCPHFLELKWAYGCPHDCAWCYLKGTFRFRPEGIKPAFKERKKIALHVGAFLEQVAEPGILNTGEIADSLMGENGANAFSRFIIPMFENQSKHRVLFVTKSNKIRHLLEIDSHNQVIVSFSLNAMPVAEEWEKRAPSVRDRIEVAAILSRAGYEVRLRIDPMVPIEGWEKCYRELVDMVFARFVPERITLGSLRGLQSTINGTSDTSWVKYLKETSNWGRKIDFTTRYDMYLDTIGYLKRKWEYEKVALCKETKAMWRKLELDYKQIRCNCIN